MFVVEVDNNDPKLTVLTEEEVPVPRLIVSFDESVPKPIVPVPLEFMVRA